MDDRNAVRFHRARQSFDLGQLEEAERELRALLRELPPDADADRLEARLLLTSVLDAQCNYIDAVAEGRALVEQAPDDARTHIALAEALNIGQAAEVLRVARLRLPDSFDLLTASARIFNGRGDEYDLDALELLDQAEALKPGDPEVARLRADIRRRRGEAHDAAAATPPPPSLPDDPESIFRSIFSSPVTRRLPDELARMTEGNKLLLFVAASFVGMVLLNRLTAAKAASDGVIQAIAMVWLVVLLVLWQSGRMALFGKWWRRPQMLDTFGRRSCNRFAAAGTASVLLMASTTAFGDATTTVRFALPTLWMLQAVPDRIINLGVEGMLRALLAAASVLGVAGAAAAWAAGASFAKADSPLNVGLMVGLFAGLGAAVIDARAIDRARRQLCPADGEGSA